MVTILLLKTNIYLCSKNVIAIQKIVVSDKIKIIYNNIDKCSYIFKEIYFRFQVTDISHTIKNLNIEHFYFKIHTINLYSFSLNHISFKKNFYNQY